ncbi:TPA: hypothetical protein KLA72_001652 [Campylobacter jejuni]|nr:hypothetical protein [Campylobacter jejuni]
MFGSKINHSDLQKLEEENKNLTHKIEKFQSENFVRGILKRTCNYP